MKNSTLETLKEKINPLIGSSESELESKAEFLNRLSSIAKPSKNASYVNVTKSRRKSKHYFHVPAEFAEENKNDVGYSHLAEEPDNLDIMYATEKYQHKIGLPVGENLDIVSDFLLKEIIPLLLGLDAGVEKTKAILHNTLGDIDNYPFVSLELLTREAVKKKLSEFIAEYFGFPKEDALYLAEKVVPKQPLVMLNQKYEDKPAKKDSSG